MPISNYLPNSRISQSGVVPNEAGRPASPYTGQVIYQLDTLRTLVWNGTAWVDLSTGTTNQPGLELVKTQTVGSAVSSVTVSDVFSANFVSYKIVYSGGTSSANTDYAIRLGASTTAYYGVMIYGIVGGSTLFAQMNNATSFNWVGGAEATRQGHVSVELHGPYLPNYTKFRNGSYQANLAFGSVNGDHRVATSYTDFTLIVNSGTITGGTICVYGYRN
jgi:hypothetical protein